MKLQKKQYKQSQNDQLRCGSLVRNLVLYSFFSDFCNHNFANLNEEFRSDSKGSALGQIQPMHHGKRWVKDPSGNIGNI